MNNHAHARSSFTRPKTGDPTMSGEFEVSREAAKARTRDAEALSTLVVDCAFLVRVKSVEKLAPVHAKQALTYIQLLGLPIDLLINFGAPTFKEGIERIVNHHDNFASSRLRVNQGLPAGISREAAKARRWEDVP